LPARWSILLTFARVGRLELQVAAMKQFRQSGSRLVRNNVLKMPLNAHARGKSLRRQRRNPMDLILIILIIVLLFGGGGYWGRRRGHW
jgi:hypothetical protein